MGTDKSHVHKPGSMKQSNKAHKSRFRSKGAIDAATKGKVSVKQLSKKRKTEMNREQRRNQATQIRQNKRDEVLSKKRMIGGFDNCPFFVCIVSLNKEYDPVPVLSMLTKCDPDCVVHKSSSGIVHITLPRFKQRFSFVIPPMDNELAVLDAMKVSNTTIFVVSAVAGIYFGSETIDKWGNRLLLSSFGQGLPTPLLVVTDLNFLSQKKKTDHKNSIQKAMNLWFPNEKVFSLEKEVDAINLLRKIGSQKLKPVTFRDKRPHLYAEDYQYELEDECKGTLKVTGYLRGAPLSANDLVYIPGLGTCQMSHVEGPADPLKPENKKDDLNMSRIIQRADPEKQESLASENVPDPMDAEQTWPTEEDMKIAEDERKKKKVPKGWSEYQAAWIPDVDAEDDSDDETAESDKEDEDNFMDAESEEQSIYSDAEEEYDTVTISEVPVDDQQYDEQLDLHAERTELEKLKAAKDDLLFPDEIDTPQDIPARERFQKYRGLASFKESPWDPKENLPFDYARIFHIENFDRVKKVILKQAENKEGVSPGTYVTVHVKDVPKVLWEAFQSTKPPLVVFGLHQHENKMSVVNVVLKRTDLYDEPIKSKDRLIFQCGYRRFIVNPIFSQHTNGSKHKYERFFQPGKTVVATFYAPIQYPPSPVLCYKEVNGRLTLVATGGVLSCNPDRLIIKRTVLSGHPLKVHKKSAVVRFMFFNREDIIYFKKVELRTKYGRTGHIKEPLGTHGHMKCVFNAPIKSQDTILLNLYKRVYPKWNYEECIVRALGNDMDI